MFISFIIIDIKPLTILFSVIPLSAPVSPSHPCKMTKKVFHSREHRERSQPANRSRLGLLEKKKDYVLRARDFQSKKKRLQGMKIKAAYKNPDEFYFGMIKNRVDKKSGRVRLAGDHEKISSDVIKLMKSQDLTHIQEMIRVNEAKLDNFRAEHSIIISQEENRKKTKNAHIKFVEDDEDLADLIIENGNEESSSDNENNSETVDPSNSSDNAENIMKEYQARIDRISALKIAEKKLLQERLAAAKGRKHKVGEDANGIAIYKFDPERKR